MGDNTNQIVGVFKPENEKLGFKGKKKITGSLV
jgi:hypothetical protein